MSEKKKLRSQNFEIKVMDMPIYRGRFIILLTNQTSQVKKHFPFFPNESDEPYACTLHGSYEDIESFAIVLNPWNNTSSITDGCVAHECLHLVNYIFANRNINYDLDNDEPAAYLINWLVDQTYSFLRETKTSHLLNRDLGQARIDAINGVHDRDLY